MIRNIKTFEKYLVILLLFLLPTQLAYHFWPSWAFVFGIRVDLLSPSVYLTDILVLILVFFNLGIFRSYGVFKNYKKYLKYPFVVLVFAFINCVCSASPPVSIFKWFKVAEFSFLVLYFSKQQILKTSSIVGILFYSLITFSLIGVFQFFKGGTVGRVFYLLGERSFNQSTPGIALVGLGGAEHLRAYSTFSHPNSLAGFLGAGIVFILLSGKLKKNILNFMGVLVILSCFVLTFSVSAYLGIFFVFAYYLFSKNRKTFKGIVVVSFFLSVVGSLLLPLVSSWILKTLSLTGQSIVQRLDLAFMAGQMINQKFLIGEGLGTFIVNIPTFKGIFSYSWLLQPVHNLSLLVFAETGIVGLLVFCFLVYKTLTKQLEMKKICLVLPLMFVLFTGLFDHYTLTLQQNLLLFSIFIGISFHAKMA